MNNNTDYEVLIRTDNYKTTISRVSKDTSIYKPNNPNQDRKAKGLNGLSKKDKDKGKNTAIAMSKYYRPLHDRIKITSSLYELSFLITIFIKSE